MGGQQGVLNFRNGLHRSRGGAIVPLAPLLGPNDVGGQDAPGGTGHAGSSAGGSLGQPVTGAAGAGAGGSLGPGTAPTPGSSQSQDATVHGAAPEGFVPGQTAESLGIPNVQPDGSPLTAEQQTQKAMMDRLAGFIPQASKANKVSGTSNLSRIWMAAGDVVNGIIEMAGSAASSAIGMAATAGSMGMGGQAGGAAASLAIGLGTEAAKRTVSYWYQMAGIGTDALVEQIMPFGAPAFMGFDSAGDGMSVNGLIQGEKKKRQDTGVGVFDTGGVLPAGGGAVNMSKQPEAILTKQQWDAMSANGGAAQGRRGSVNIENVQVSDVNEMSKSIDRRQKLAGMQYTGRPGM
jgi:hypothetical protein